MKGKKLLAVLTVSAMLFAGCASKEAIIRINDKVITQADFNKAFDRQVNNSALAKMGVKIKEDKNGFMYLMLKDRVVNELIIRTLIEEELTKRGIKVTKKDVDEAVKEVIERVGSKEQLDVILKQNGVSASKFRQDLEEEVKMKRLAQELGSSEVSDAEAQKFYKDNVAKFKYPEKVRASHILIAANPEEIEEVVKSDANNKGLSDQQVKTIVNNEMNARKAKADELYNQAKLNIEDFARLAKENSDDTTSAVKGGDLGFFAKEEMVPEFSKAAFAQRPNSVAPVVKSQYGYHIILVTDRMEAGQEPFEKAKANIINYLSNQKQLRLLDSLVESLKKNSNIEFVNPEYDPKFISDQVQNGVKQQQEAEKQ